MNPRTCLAVLLLGSTVFAFGGAHGGFPLPPPPPPLPPPPPPPVWPGDTTPGAPAGPAHGPAAAPTGGPSSGPGAAATGGNGGSASTGGGGGGAVATGTGSTVNSGTAPKFPTGPATGMPVEEFDTTTWEYWWVYNKDAYLEVKRHIAASAVASGPDAALDSARAWDEIGETVLARVVAALEVTRDNDGQLSAMIAAARLCDGRVRSHAAQVGETLRARWKDPNRDVAEGAVIALGVLGADASVSDLCALLGDTSEARKSLGGREVSERMRAFAAYSLGLLAQRSENAEVRRFARHHLVRQLEQAERATPDLQTACSIALGLVDTRANRPADADAASGPQRTLGPGALPDEDTRLLLGWLADTKASTYVRAHVPRSLARRTAGSPASRAITTALLERLEDPAEKAEIVQGAVAALGIVADAGRDDLSARVQRVLLRQTDQGDVQARCFALVSLAQIASRSGDAEATAAARARCVEGLRMGRSRERTWSALALGVLEHGGADAPTEVANLLVKQLTAAKAPDEVGALAIGCGLAGVRAAVPNLVARLDTTKDLRALAYVQTSLGLLGAGEARARLTAMLDEGRTSAEKLPAAALALTLLEDASLTDRLVALLDTSTSQATQLAVMEALGTSGDRRAIEPLMRVAGDERFTAHSRSAAVSALGRVADRDALPWQHAIAQGLNYRAMTATLSAADRGGLLDLH